MLNGVGMGDAQMKKISLIKRLTNQGHNFQVMGINSLKEFLKDGRLIEEQERMEAERQAKEKDRILRRIMDGNVRLMGTGFRQALQFTESEREKERALILKQRGIMRRIVDKNTRMNSAAYNKLMEVYKEKQNEAKEKLKFIIAALTDSDKAFTLMAYNGLKQRWLMLSGAGMGEAEMKKIQLIKRLTNQGHNLQVMACNTLKDFLKDAR